MVDTTITFDGRYYESGDLPAIRVYDNGDSTFSMAMHSPAVGNPDDSRETDPDSSSSTLISLMRACHHELINIRVQLAAGIEVTNTVNVSLV
jgi:hypothetical protein